MKVESIEGIGKKYAETLQKVEIVTVEDLLKVGCSPAGRKMIAEKTGIDHAKVLDWVNRADLFRIEGIGEEYSDLLEAAGVDTVVELAKRVPENLQHRMAEVNEQKKLVRKVPSLTSVQNWIEQAKKLPRVVEY